MRTISSTWPALPRITVKMTWGRMPAATRLRTARRAASNDPGTPRTHSWVAASAPSMLTETNRRGDFAISAAISGVHSRPLVSIVNPNSSRRTISSNRVMWGCSNGSPPVSFTPLKPRGFASRIAVSNSSTGKVGYRSPAASSLGASQQWRQARLHPSVR